MLMESQVDPFDAQEAKPYKNDSEVQAMTNLVDAYQRNNIKDFEKILRTNKCVLCLAWMQSNHNKKIFGHDAHSAKRAQLLLFAAIKNSIKEIAVCCKLVHS